MKKFFLLALATFGIVAFAQAQVKVGAHLGYGTKTEKLHFGVNGEYAINEKFAIAPDFSFYLPESNSLVSSTAMEFNANLNYYLMESGSLKVYGLGGLHYYRWSSETKAQDLGFGMKIPAISNSGGEFGVNLGAGVAVGFGENLECFGQIKYTIVSDFSQLVPQVGIRYKF